MYGEGQGIQGGGAVFRGGPFAVANSAVITRYVIQRQYVYEAGHGVYEENFDIQGNTDFGAAVNAIHRVSIIGTVPFDNTVDAYLEIYLGNNFAGSNDQAFVHTAQAYIQAPLNLNRFPQ